MLVGKVSSRPSIAARFLSAQRLKQSEAIETKHVPVLLEEVINMISPSMNSCDEPVFVDMTFGCGGHSSAVLKKWPRAHLFCLDQDPEAIERCRALKNPQISPLLGRFRDIRKLVGENIKVDAFLFDLGVSSPQFNCADRGFSLSIDGPLDMRMNRSDAEVPSAANVVNQLPVKDLARIFKIYGEERNAEEIARAIVDYRNYKGSILTTMQLARIIESVSSHVKDKLGRYAHPATKTFQALRIFVNDELNDLKYGLEIAHDLLKPKGRCAVISFHSLEDRLVKRIFHGVTLQPPLGVEEFYLQTKLRRSTEPLTREQMEALISRKWKPLTGRNFGNMKNAHHSIISPTQLEVDRNPRARSAKLRIAEKSA